MSEDRRSYLRRHGSQLRANLEANDHNLKEGWITKAEHKRRKHDGNAALRELAQDRCREGDKEVME